MVMLIALILINKAVYSGVTTALPSDHWSLYTGLKWSLGSNIVVVNCNSQVVWLGKLIGLLITFGTGLGWSV